MSPRRRTECSARQAGKQHAPAWGQAHAQKQGALRRAPPLPPTVCICQHQTLVVGLANSSWPTLAAKGQLGAHFMRGLVKRPISSSRSSSLLPFPSRRLPAPAVLAWSSHPPEGPGRAGNSTRHTRAASMRQGWGQVSQEGSRGGIGWPLRYFGRLSLLLLLRRTQKRFRTTAGVAHPFSASRISRRRLWYILMSTIYITYRHIHIQTSMHACMHAYIHTCTNTKTHTGPHAGLRPASAPSQPLQPLTRVGPRPVG